MYIKNHLLSGLFLTLSTFTFGLTEAVQAAEQPHQAVEIKYMKTDMQDTKIFYREAGDPKKPTIILLHGFPTS